MSKLVKKNLDAKFAGEEPRFDSIDSRSDPKLTRAFSWYNYIHDEKQSQSWLLQWMKEQKYSKSDLEVVKGAPPWASGITAGWVARMHLNGTQFPDENLQYIRDKISDILDRYSVKEESTNVVDLQARVRSKNKLIMELAEEEVIDAFALANFELNKSLSMYDFLLKYTVSTRDATQLKEVYEPHLIEVMSDDSDIKECYGKRLKNSKIFYQAIINDLNRYLNNKKVVRVKKPKIAKLKPASKLVENVKYQKDFGPLKLVSLDPQNILGVQQLWTYNTKYKVLTVYHASDPKGFEVKGTTLQKFDTEKSQARRLRKPEIILTNVLSAGKVAIKHIMAGLTTTPLPVTGRLNDDTILLRVIK